MSFAGGVGNKARVSGGVRRWQRHLKKLGCEEENDN